MVKKSVLRSEFERLEKNTHFISTVVKIGIEPNIRYMMVNNLPVNSFRLDIVQNGLSYQIVLYAVHSLQAFAVIARSYPFHSYKSAYQTLVRLF